MYNVPENTLNHRHSYVNFKILLNDADVGITELN